MLSPQDNHAIRSTVLRFFRLVDEGRADETIGLFASDASITFGAKAPKPGNIQGDAISDAMRARATQTDVTTRHAISNFHIESTEDGCVICTFLLTLYRTDSGRENPFPPTVADVRDVLSKQAGGEWKICERTINPIF